MGENAREGWRTGLMAMLLCIVGPFAADCYIPSLPAITKAFSSTANQMQFTMSLYFLGAAFSQLVYGPLSDRYGRRVMVLIGLGICTLGSFLCILSTSAGMLIGARFLKGFGAGACNVLFRAILRDTYQGTRLAQIGSYIGIIFPVTFAIAPIIGGYVESAWGWRENFLVVTLILFLTTLVIKHYLPETNQHLDHTATTWKSMYRNYRALLTHKKFMGYTLLSSVTFAGMICYYSTAPFLLQDIVGLTPVQFGWLSVFLSIGIIASQFLNSRLVMKYGIAVMIKAGIIIALLSGLIMLLFALYHIINTPVIVIPAVIFCFASGFIFSNAMAGAFEFFGHMAGITGALYGFLQMMGGVIPSMLLSGVILQNQLPLSIIFTGIGFAAMIIFYFLLYRNENSSHGQ
jgi:DHA1 family 2-module integral membrane pump EmrD-like MFS transporter